MDLDTSLILHFLDLEDPKKQAEFLQAHCKELTDKFLVSAAVSLDYVETGEDLESRCQDLIRYLNTKGKYESGRR
ncbi:MAG: hypothetical protein HFH53_03740 [Hespellia sp.]|jgi:hypothetical protein|nr:hypothetical protein [Hespellia sp.]